MRPRHLHRVCEYEVSRISKGADLRGGKPRVNVVLPRYIFDHARAEAIRRRIGVATVIHEMILAACELEGLEPPEEPCKK